MMRQHCDRCDALCDEHQTWVEDAGAVMGINGRRMTGDAIWHVAIYAGGPRSAELHDIPNELKMFCRVCRIAILEAYVKTLKLVKGTGGHLADCKWDASYARYDCADECEIKRINKSIPASGRW